MDLTNHPAGTGEAVTNWATLSFRGHDLLTVWQNLTLHLVTNRNTIVADTDVTGLWFPDLVVVVEFPIHSAVIPTCALIYSCNKEEGQFGNSTFQIFVISLTKYLLSVASLLAVIHTGQHSPSGVTVFWQSPKSSQITSSHTMVPISQTQARHGSEFHMSLWA